MVLFAFAYTFLKNSRGDIPFPKMGTSNAKKMRNTGRK
jgi:hypothetical protein